MVVHDMLIGPHMWGNIWLRRFCSGAYSSIRLFCPSTIHLGYEEVRL